MLSNLWFFWLLDLIRNNRLLGYNLSWWLNLASSSILVLVRLGSFNKSSGSSVPVLKGTIHGNGVKHGKGHHFFLHELAIQHFDVIYVVSQLLLPLRKSLRLRVCLSWSQLVLGKVAHPVWFFWSKAGGMRFRLALMHLVLGDRDRHLSDLYLKYL